MGALRIGLLGGARIARNALVRPARGRADEAQVTAVAARDVGRARQFAERHGIAQVHATYDDLIDDAEIDAVYNPLPNGLHCAWTLRALRAGKHVLCEKPLAANAAEAVEMARVADEMGLVLMEAFHYRYHPYAARIRGIVEGGALGEIQRVESFFCVPMLRRNDIRFRFDLAGGALMDLGCYCVNLVRYLVGAEPEVVGARAVRFGDEIDREMEVDLRFPGGQRGRVVCSFNAWRRPLKVVTRVVGSRGTMDAVNPFLPMLFNWIAVKTEAGTRRAVVRGETTYDYQLGAFVRAVRLGEPFATTARDGVATMRVIDAAYRRAGLRVRGE